MQIAVSLPFIRKTLASTALGCLLALGAGSVAAADSPAVPPAFARLVPPAMDDGLQLVEIRQRCQDCPAWRVVDFHGKEPGSPVRREKVSVAAGVTAMYAYPGTGYFANVKIERSLAGRYEEDRSIVLAALEHEYARKKERLAAYLAANPAIREKVDQLLPAGKEHIEFERRTRGEIEVASYTENAIGLSSSAISQVHIFVPREEIIITAYLLNQKNARFKDIGEFLALRSAFIGAWTDFLARDSARP
jgi:hypothetical protein